MSSTQPQVTSTSPSDTATDVALNAKLLVTFDMAMVPLSASSFTLTQGTTAMTGALATSADGTAATFSPATPLVASTLYSAMITTGATSTGGESLAAATAWTFTTGTTSDTTAPVVISESPAANSTGAAINTKISVTFDKTMDPLSITAATFTVMNGTTPVAGTVTLGPSTTATFTPATALATNTLFTATATSAVADLQGNALAGAFVWTFTTGTASRNGPSPVGLGAAGNFAILAKTAISSVPTSAVTGNIGVSPAAATYITGFSLVADATNVFATSTQIVGEAFAADYAVPTPINLTTAVSNMETAYTDAAGRPTPDYTELGSGNIGGKTLVPGLYKWTTTVTIPTDVTLSGGPNDVWIFQTSKDLTMAAAKHVILSGGALAKNVFWQIAGQMSVGANSHFEGVVLCKTMVTLQTGATMNGRVLAQTEVDLQQASLTVPAL